MKTENIDLADELIRELRESEGFLEDLNRVYSIVLIAGDTDEGEVMKIFPDKREPKDHLDYKGHQFIEMIKDHFRAKIQTTINALKPL